MAKYKIIFDGEEEDEIFDTEEEADTEDGIQSMVDFLDGREMEDFKRTGVNIHSNVDLQGKTKQETCTYEVELDDGTEILVEFEYLSDREGEGFAYIRLSLGN